MKKIIFLFFLFCYGLVNSQELMNFYANPTQDNELIVTTFVYRNYYSKYISNSISANENDITIKLCYVNTSYAAITNDRQDIPIQLPAGYNTFSITIELYGDNDDLPCTYDNLEDIGVLTLDYPYNPLETTFIPDNTFENYIEEFGFGDDIANNDDVFTHRIQNMKRLYLNNVYPEPLIQSLEGIQDFSSLEFLRCNGNLISNLDLISEFNLTELWSFDNPIENLDVTNYSNLIDLRCGLSNLTQLNISNNPLLKVLYCENSQLTEVDFSQNEDLIFLNISNSQFNNLDVSNNQYLEYLYCNNNQLKYLDVTNNPNLIYFNFEENLISEVDLSQNINLREIRCSDNQLTNLDTSNLSNLTFLGNSNNLMTTLNFSNNVNLRNLYLFNNEELTTINLKNGINADMEQVVIFGSPNLMCVEVDDPSEAPYPD